jgi:hypothetical protein
LLDLNDLEEVNEYSPPSLLLVVKLISVERMDSAFLGALLITCSLFRLQLQLSFEYINFFEKECQRLLSGSSFGSKASLVVFLLFKLGDCSTIRCVVVVLITIVTPHVGSLRMIRRLSNTNGSLNA